MNPNYQQQPIYSNDPMEVRVTEPSYYPGAVQQQQPYSQGPVGFVQVAPIGVAYNVKNYLTFSILNAVFCLPWFVFWIPALICSLVSRSKAEVNDLKSARKLASASLALNITCTIGGLLAYILICVLVPLYYLGMLGSAGGVTSLISSVSSGSSLLNSYSNYFG